MIGIVQTSLLTLLLISWSGMALALSCPASKSLLTEENRDRIFGAINRDRELIRKGELLLADGHYALQGGFMKNLTWDCSVESQLAEFSEALCNGEDYPSPGPSAVSTANFYRPEFSIDQHVDVWMNGGIYFNASTFTSLQHETIFPWYGLPFVAFHLMEISTTTACAAYECTARNYTELWCKSSPTININETLYTPGNPDVVTTPAAPQASCPFPWVFYGNSCYRYVSGMDRNQAKAEQWCVNQGKKGHLVSIHSEGENNFVKSLILPSDNNVLIGYNNNAWTDATPVNFNNFMVPCGNNACASMSTSNNQWKSVDCNSPFKQFVCKRNV